jgi:hypothetical protein
MSAGLALSLAGHAIPAGWGLTVVGARDSQRRFAPEVDNFSGIRIEAIPEIRRGSGKCGEERGDRSRTTPTRDYSLPTAQLQARPRTPL